MYTRGVVLTVVERTEDRDRYEGAVVSSDEIGVTLEVDGQPGKHVFWPWTSVLRVIA